MSVYIATDKDCQDINKLRKKLREMEQKEANKKSKQKK